MYATEVKCKVTGTIDKGCRNFRQVEQEEISVCTVNPTRKEQRLKEAKKAKAKYRFKIVCNQAKELVCYIPMEFRNNKAGRKWRGLEESELYSSYLYETTRFASKWARYMQWLMNKHDKDLKSIAENSLRICKSISDEEISGFKVKCAVNMLVPRWKYGNELQAWYDERHGYED